MPYIQSQEEMTRNVSKQKHPTILRQTNIQTEGFSGPLPHPDILIKYNKINEGFADRVICLAETEALHRREIEKSLLEADINVFNKQLDHSAIETRIGQFLGFLIGLSAIVSGCVTSIYGHQVSGTLIGSSGVIGLVTVFIKGRGDDKKRNK